jgi:hypothetical protein
MARTPDNSIAAQPRYEAESLWHNPLVPELRMEADDWLLKDYPTPSDQFAIELELIDNFKQRFPEEVQLLIEVLNDVKRYIGIGIPKYGLAPEALPDAKERGIIDELGLLKSQSQPIEFGISKLTLVLPKESNAEEIPKLSKLDKAKAYADEDGVTVVGPAPDYTQVLLAGVYKLCGAKTILEDTWQADTQGRSKEVLRQGEYQGVPVYFLETHRQAAPYYGDQTTLNVAVIGSLNVQYILRGPLPSQAQEFMKISGMHPSQYIGAVMTHGLTKDNYLEIARILAQTREAVDKTKDSTRR